MARLAAERHALAGRAAGRPAWGVLRGDVDNFGIRLRRAQTIEEHVQLSVMYKKFFAGELEVLCSHAGVLAQGEHPLFRRRRLRGLRRLGRVDPAGARDAAAVPPLHRREPEGLSRPRGQDASRMALALARRPDAPLARCLPASRASSWSWPSRPTKIASHLFGRTLEWKHVAEAAESRTRWRAWCASSAARGSSCENWASFYREPRAPDRAPAPREADRFDRPWRFHRRLNRMVAGRARPRVPEAARAACRRDDRQERGAM